MQARGCRRKGSTAEAAPIGFLMLCVLAGGAAGGGFQGPLGIAKMGNEIARNDAAELLDFAALISINLAVLNSLPLPGDNRGGGVRWARYGGCMEGG